MSGVFLWILGILNLAVLLGIIKVFRRMRRGEYDEAALEEHLDKRGFMNRFLNGLTKSVRKAWHIYPVGVLFGLGFDTATEVGLLVLAGGAAAFNLPFYSILVLPILFAAGMCLMDTVDGVFMNAAYGWAFAKPVRKVFYNITITTISVAVALIIGTIELIGVLADQAHITTGPLAAIAGIPLDYAGYGIVGAVRAVVAGRAAGLALRPHRGALVGRTSRAEPPAYPLAALDLAEVRVAVADHGQRDHPRKDQGRRPSPSRRPATSGRRPATSRASPDARPTPPRAPPAPARRSPRPGSGASCGRRRRRS